MAFKKPTTVTNPTELKQKVYTLIDKLSDRSTLSHSLSELQYIATTTLDVNNIPTFLSCIMSLDTSTKPSVRAHCIRLIPILVNSFGESVLSLYVSKIISGVLLKRLRDPDTLVRAALVAAVESLVTISNGFLVSTFVSAVLSEQEVNAQISACHCLKAAVDADHGDGVVDDDGGEIKRALPKMIGMLKKESFKAKAALLGVIGSFVKVNNGNVVGKSMVGSVVSISVEMLGFDDWSVRKAAAEVLEIVALVVEIDWSTEFKVFCVNAIEAKRFDKVKITRETMNRALEAWKEVPGGPEEDLPLSRSNSTSKDSGNGRVTPPLSRRYSIAGSVAPKPKKTITKTRSSLSEDLHTASSSSYSTSTSDIVGFETPQRKKTISKTRSSLSDDSTITDSSSVSRSSFDIGFDTPQSRKPVSKRSSLPNNFISKKKSASKGNDSMSSSWNVQIAVPPLPSRKVVSESEVQSQFRTAEVTTSGSGMSSSISEKTSEEMEQKFGDSKYGSRVVPFPEDDTSQDSGLEDGVDEEVGENSADVEELSLIRKQLLQIERQQASLLVLMQRFMGNSQSGINSLETRVSGLERALDEISYDLALQSGRIPNNDFAGSTCCPSTEFLSPKFWKKTDGRSSTLKMSSNHGNVEALQMDGHRFQDQNEGLGRDSRSILEYNSPRGVKSIGQNAHRGRTCSPRSFDAAPTAAWMTPGVRGS